MPFFKKTKKVKKELPKIDVIQTDITELQLKPFPHQNVQNFLKPDFFEDINKYLYQILSRGILSADAPRDPTKFTFFPGLKNTSYFQLTPECGYPMNQFMTKTWIEYFSILYDMPLTNTLAMSFHHHSHNSGGRHAHTDYHLIGFPKSVQRDDPNELVVYNDPTPYYSLVVNDREKASHLGLDVQMRECAALIYLNPPYKAFTGGETGLFENYQH